MFKLIVTTTNQQTGETKKETVRYRYKTLRGAENAANNIRRASIPDSKSVDVEIIREHEHKQPVSLEQAMFRAGLATSLFYVILEKASTECSADLNNLIALACDINQEIYRSLFAIVYRE
ncbi:hypothetical protein HGO23_02340 [Xenorhabdus budapestensis]|uniref:Uncharacterized protein n=1 Tax=Xenorhabdus budapestensis TaxID=290110 RepID=A0ABX7VL69_XENBU|nr:hypothetical protein [Xenorhabdus budapestensis]QTL40280.1 hypothetical protein HGO23_02340 [Xenorhabdus budapestensis]